jgi:aspartate/methionine/tyrosine aminotransferase
MARGALPPLAASLSSRAISVTSLSKTYGLPGIRIGWLVNRDPLVMERFLAAKEQIFICGSVLDEEVACQYLRKKAHFLPMIRQHIDANFQVLRDWMTESRYMEWVEPQGGVVSFPRIRPEVNVNIDQFHRVLIEKYKTFVGPGHWFECDRRYMRLGFGWPSQSDLEGGLQSIQQANKDMCLEPGEEDKRPSQFCELRPDKICYSLMEPSAIHYCIRSL